MRRIVRPQFTLEYAIPWFLFLAADGFLLFTDTRWVGELTWAVEWANGGLYLSSSLLAAITVFINRSLLTHDAVTLLGARSFGGGTRHVLAIWARSFVFGASAHLVVVIVALLWTTLAGTTDTLTWQPFAYALFPLAYAVTLGVVIAVFIPSVVGSALALALAYIVGYLAATGVLQLPVITGGITGSLVGIEFSGAVVLQYAGSAVLISVLGVLGALLVMRTRSGAAQPWSFVAAIVVSILLPGLFLPVLPDRGAAGSTVAGTTCAGRAPRVCVLNGHTRHLEQVAAGVSRVAAPLADAGVDLGQVVLTEAPVNGTTVRGEVLGLDSSRLNRGDFSTIEYAQAVTEPAQCAGAALSGSSERLLMTSNDLTMWLAARAGDAFARKEPAASRSEQWAARAYDQIMTCP